ncbi:MAG: hypothetical protein QF473_15070 [Planctomycetota bacterium]|jgi:hypothetical protein|nr:hypothetical protein [Planctomycetota bacterium]
MNKSDKGRLRDLAAKYAEYAFGEPMAQRREKWRVHNRLQEKTYPFHIEDNGSFFRDLTPPLECESDECRALEGRILHALVAYERIDDDRIIPDRFVIDWCTPITGNCDELQFTRADNGRGSSLGYRTNKPIKDIDADMGKLKKRTISLDKERTERQAHLAEEVFAGILPVEVGRPSSLYSNGITNTAVHLMGMQELYLQMAMNPDAVHRLFAFLAEDNLTLGQWEEDQELLTLNHDGNQGYCSGSSQFSDETAVPAGNRVVSTDRYGYLESQESAGISADMFTDFLMPHFTRFASKFKLLKFGCCEAVHDLMPALQRLPGLRKVSVTPWCDIRKLTETCREDIIWSRKPIPLKLCGETFVLDDLRNHLQKTLDIGKDYFIEFVYRDTNPLTGDMTDRIAQTCDMIRELTGHPEGSRG